MNKIFRNIFIGMGTLCTVATLTNADAQISSLRQGRLPNGLTYYISKDAGASQGEAHFYLLQNVGAVLENEHQNGLAHYLEHMAFEATEHFPQGVMNYLRQRGLYQFDARTGEDETRYSISGVPTRDKGLTDSVLLILKDWCQGISITDKDTEKQRNIIIEEWRQRNDVHKRLSNAIAPVVYNHSIYGARSIIGSLEVLRQFKYQDIAAFYRQWYRPDLQCIIVVGDIDPADYEQRVRQLFSSLKMPQQVSPRLQIKMDSQTKPLYYRFIDPENPSASIGLYERREEPSLKGEAASKSYLLTRIFNQLSKQRIDLIRQSEQEQFVALSLSYSPLVRGYGQVAWDVVPYPSKEIEALRQLFQLREALRTEGFTSEEFQAEQEKIYQGYKAVLSDSKGLGTPENFMNLYKNNYLYGTPMVEFSAQLKENMEQLVELEVEDLNSWVKHLLDDPQPNWAFITYSRRSDEMNISLDQCLGAERWAKANPLSLRRPTPEPITRLLDFPIGKGKIVKQMRIPELGAERWTLSNGATVVYKQLPALKGGVYVAASALGGRSAVAPTDLPSFTAMRDLLMQSGVHHYDRQQLGAWLKGQSFDLNISISDYMDAIGGMTPKDELRTMMEYIYLILTKQRFDSKRFDKYIALKRYLYDSRVQTERTAIEDSIQQLLTPTSPTNPREDDAFYAQMKLADLPRLFADRFGDMGQFSWGIIGDLSPEEAKSIATNYIATLPGKQSAKPKRYQAIDKESPEQEIVREFTADLQGDLAEVEIAYIHNQSLTPKQELSLSLLEQLLQHRLFDELREKEAGTYSVAVSTSYTPLPSPKERLNIHFSTERAKVDRLKAKTYDILRQVAQGVINQEEYKKVQAAFVLATEGNAPKSSEERDPMEWISLIGNYLQTGQLSGNTDKAVSGRDISPQDISAIAQLLLSQGKHRDLIIRSIAPEAKAFVH